MVKISSARCPLREQRCGRMLLMKLTTSACEDTCHCQYDFQCAVSRPIADGRCGPVTFPTSTISPNRVTTSSSVDLSAAVPYSYTTPSLYGLFQVVNHPSPSKRPAAHAMSEDVIWMKLSPPRRRPAGPPV